MNEPVIPLAEIEDIYNNTASYPELVGELGKLFRKYSPLPRSLMGKWATHPSFGRVLIIDNQVDTDGTIKVSFIDDEDDGTCTWEYAEFEHLTLEDLPKTLVTKEELMSVPEGTVIAADSRSPLVCINSKYGHYMDFTSSSVHVNDIVGDTFYVLRYGWRSNG